MSQRGFTPILVILAVAIVSILILAGFYIFSTRESDNLSYGDQITLVKKLSSLYGSRQIVVTSTRVQPMIMVSREPCDVDNDNDCDNDDFLIFQAYYYGACQSGNRYNELADADHDGCVTAVDQKILFPQYKLPRIERLEDKAGGWETYRDNELLYEFHYPPKWSEPSRGMDDTDNTFVIEYAIDEGRSLKYAGNGYGITHRYIASSVSNTTGIPYCDSHRDDISRCETIKIAGVEAVIDWQTLLPDTEQSRASVQIPHPKGGIVTFKLYPVVPKSKETMYQILSTLQFLN